jgi:hypothetical protein
MVAFKQQSLQQQNHSVRVTVISQYEVYDSNPSKMPKTTRITSQGRSESNLRQAPGHDRIVVLVADNKNDNWNSDAHAELLNNWPAPVERRRANQSELGQI